MPLVGWPLSLERPMTSEPGLRVRRRRLGQLLPDQLLDRVVAHAATDHLRTRPADDERDATIRTSHVEHLAAAIAALANSVARDFDQHPSPLSPVVR